MHRKIGDIYLPVEPDAEGRVWSAAIGVGFGIEAGGFLRAYDADGHPLPSPKEAEQLRREAEQRAEEQRLRAEEEARLRREAEQRATEAEEKQTDLASRVAALEAELAQLRKDG